MLKGWRTYIAAASVAILAGLQTQTFKDAIGGCIFSTDAVQPASCVFPPSVIAGIAALMFALRFITTTASFRKD